MIEINKKKSEFKIYQKSVIGLFIISMIGILLIFYVDNYVTPEYSYQEEYDDYEEGPSILSLILLSIPITILMILLSKTYQHIKYWKNFKRDTTVTILISYFLTSILLLLLNISNWFYAYSATFGMVTVCFYTYKEFKKQRIRKERMDNFKIDEHQLNNYLGKINDYKRIDSVFQKNFYGGDYTLFVSQDFGNLNLDYLNYEVNRSFEPYPGMTYSYRYLILVNRNYYIDNPSISGNRLIVRMKVYDVSEELYLGDIVFELYMQNKSNQDFSAQELDVTVIGYFNDLVLVDIKYE